MSTASIAGAHLDVVAHRLGPRLGAEDADLDAHRARVDALALELLDDHLHVARRDHDDVGLKVADQLHLLLGLSARHRDHRAAQPLSAVVRAQAAGEQAVAVGDVHDVAGAAAGGADRARDQSRPSCRCRSGCSPRRWACRWCLTTRGCARPVHAAPRTCRTGSCRADLSCAVNGNFARSASDFQVARMHALGVERLAIVRHALVGVLHGPLQALELQRLQLVAAGGLDRLEVAGAGFLHGHGNTSKVLVRPGRRSGRSQAGPAPRGQRRHVVPSVGAFIPPACPSACTSGRETRPRGRRAGWSPRSRTRRCGRPCSPR